VPFQPGCPVLVTGIVLHRGPWCPEDRAGAPRASGVVGPLADLGRVSLEIVPAQSRQLREAARQDQGLDAIRVAGRELDRDRAAERHTQQHGPLCVSPVQDRLDIQGQCRKAKALSLSRTIRQARAAPVEHHHPGTGREATPEVFEGRLFPGQLELADQGRDNDKRDRAVTDRRIRDRHAVIGARVAHLGPKHSLDRSHAR
jgi:hypothetical protein